MHIDFLIITTKMVLQELIISFIYLYIYIFFFFFSKLKSKFCFLVKQLTYSTMLASEVLCLVAQPCLILCSPIDYSPPSSPSMGILQASILEWLPCPPPGGLPNPGIEPRSPSLQGILYLLSYQGSPRILEWVAHPFFRGSFQPRN